jgi:hypothetical protein
MSEIGFRVTIQDEHAFAVYLHHSSKWKTAKDDLAATPWWVLPRRIRLFSEYKRHLAAAVEAQDVAIRIERTL